jgi:hypothetical protein
MFPLSLPCITVLGCAPARLEALNCGARITEVKLPLYSNTLTSQTLLFDLRHMCEEE